VIFFIKRKKKIERKNKNLKASAEMRGQRRQEMEKIIGFLLTGFDLGIIFFNLYQVAHLI